MGRRFGIIAAALCAVLAGAAAAQGGSQPVTLTAADGVKVAGAFYPAAHAHGLILLFHQAGSGKGEYASIAPRLNAAGFDALAIDQRSGGDLFGRNETAAALGRGAGYLDAKRDLEAALAWGVRRHEPVALWGSSYSAALVFLVAAEHPADVAAVLAFSPGEYLDDAHAVHAAAARVTAPVYVTSAKSAGEVAAARSLLAASPSHVKVQHVPQAGGVHGSSTLIAARDPSGAEENWRAVLAFLAALPGRPAA